MSNNINYNNFGLFKIKCSLLDNRFLYGDIKLLLNIFNKNIYHIFELQIMDKQMYKSKNMFGHKIYKITRTNSMRVRLRNSKNIFKTIINNVRETEIYEYFNYVAYVDVLINILKKNRNHLSDLLFFIKKNFNDYNYEPELKFYINIYSTIDNNINHIIEDYHEKEIK